MLLPLAFIAIGVFMIIAIYLIFRKSSGKKELRKNGDISGNENKIEKNDGTSRRP